jgi:hypothetical protein
VGEIGAHSIHAAASHDIEVRIEEDANHADASTWHIRTG